MPTEDTAPLTDTFNLLDGSRDRLDDVARASQRFGGAIGQAFKAAALEGRRFDDLLAGLGRRLLAIGTDIAFKSAGTALAAGLSTLVNGIVGGATGGSALARPLDLSAFRLDAAQPFAKGGVVAAPSLFAMPGGTGLMGEAGAEAIIPLARGPDGRLGVRSETELAAPVSVVVHVTTPDAASFRRSESYVSGVLARAVQRGRRTQ